MKNIIEVQKDIYRGTGIKRNGDTVSINLELDKNNMWSAEVRDEFGDIEHIYTDRTKDKVLSSFSDADIVKIKWNDGKVWNINEEKKMKKIIEIQEEVSIIQEDGTKVILEKGDKVEILSEVIDDYVTDYSLDKPHGETWELNIRKVKNGYMVNRVILDSRENVISAGREEFIRGNQLIPYLKNMGAV